MIITVLVIAAVVLRLTVWAVARYARHDECRDTHALGYCPMTRRAAGRAPRRNRRCC